MHAFNFQHLEYKRPFLSKTIILILKLPKLVDSWRLSFKKNMSEKFCTGHI